MLGISKLKLECNVVILWFKGSHVGSWMLKRVVKSSSPLYLGVQGKTNEWLLDVRIVFDKSCGQSELGMSKSVFAGSLSRATLTSTSLKPRRTGPESKTQCPWQGLTTIKALGQRCKLQNISPVIYAVLLRKLKFWAQTGLFSTKRNAQKI